MLESGIVDAEHGVIYKVAASREVQKRSTRRVLLWLAGGLLLPVLLSGGEFVLNGWPLKWADLQQLIVNYTMIFVGSGAHLAVDGPKNAKASARSSFQALDDWVFWVHMRGSQIAKGIYYVWSGFVLLAVGMPTLDWPAAYFAGFSQATVSTGSPTSSSKGLRTFWRPRQKSGPTRPRKLEA